MRKQVFLSLTLLMSLMVQFVSAESMTVELKKWEFRRPGEAWRQVTVPHDWAIAGPFNKDIDKQVVAIEQNGEKVATEKTGRSGSLPWIGQGEYRCNIADLLKAAKDGLKKKGAIHAELLFDGVMSEPEVFVNDKKVGEWKLGYNAFHIDITPYINDFSDEILVKCNNREESSRWYPGAGIYRPVKLILSQGDYIPVWATFIYTKSLEENDALLHFESRVAGSSKKLSVVIRNKDGKKVMKQTLAADQEGRVEGEIRLKNAKLWSPESPYLYTLEVMSGKEVLESLKVGVKTVSVSKEKGFQLNGVTRKIKGVCLHHDLGPLGAAVNKAALIRQVKILKDMGCDAIRTSHNMPSTMQMEVYDSLGMMVMAESFDMWKYPKCKNGYALFFDEWADRDIENLVLNHRNHASNIMWSIGNEIPEQSDRKGAAIVKRLQDICHRLDPSRMVTSGMDRSTAAIKSGFADALDIPGYNYRLPKYQEAYDMLHHGFLLGSETASTVSSRGVYKFPVERLEGKAYDDGQCSSYDMECCWWSNLPDDDWYWQDDKDWVIGEFVWTGFDYLGEPTPYDEYWPSRSSYFGIVDLAGLPKDRYYLYRSRWNKDAETIHLLPHWSFGEEMIGKNVPVYCYTNYNKAELFINGKSQGIREKLSKKDAARIDINSKDYDKYNRYRLRWDNTIYEPGEVKVVVYDEEGNKKGEKTIRSAGKPAQLRLTPDKPNFNADDDDMIFVTVEMMDEHGELCATANNQLEFEVSGDGEFQACCNGDATSVESFCQPTMKLFNGKLVVVVRKTGSGNATLRVKCKGLDDAEVLLHNQYYDKYVSLNGSKEDKELIDWGYGYVRKVENTQPRGGISGEELRKGNHSTILEALQGKIPGLNISATNIPGIEPEASIRGTNSFYASQTPLFVVDGIVVETLMGISVYDVDYVEVLKDASIYGSRGANGAILVHTLKAKGRK